MHRYDDIIMLPHHVSKTHPPMPAADRAAQFAPFAALTGHYDAVKETARLTEERVELDESCKAVLDGKLQDIRRRLGEEPAVTVTYFVPDERKSGGSYETAAGCVRKIDEYERVLVLTDGTRIPVSELLEIELKS
ncbi:MAG: YolD-like family protein [Dorea sp.]|nr:YolD-like family protein [Dorea sp.]